MTTMDGTLRLLLVEDSRTDAALILDELRSGGFAVTHRRVDLAKDFRTAIIERDWDVVVCDHALPQFNSRTALKMLQNVGRAIPLIIVSGVMGEDEAVEAMRAGAKDYVTKSNLRRLVPAVQREMHEARIRRMHIQAAADVKVRLVDAIESLSEGFALCDPDDCLVICNSKFLGIYEIDPNLARPGIPFEQMMRGCAAGGVMVDAAGHEGEWIEQRMRLHRSPGPSFEELTRGGRRILVSERRTRDGGTVTISADITVMKLAERELLQAQKMEAIGHLTGGIAHDFNNLLTVILLNCDILMSQLQDPRLRPVADATRAAASRGAELTQRLLAFGRRQILEPQPTDVNELIGRLVQLMRRTLGEHIEITLACAGDLWAARIDPGQLETAILNLAVNARDAMPDGGVITIETANLLLGAGDAALDSDMGAGGYVMVAMVDGGSGMAPDVLAHAFEPFYTTKQVGKGSGLGLSMVHGFVKQSGGSVRMESAQGRGTTVRLYLPRTEQPVAGVAEDSGSKLPAPRRRGTILLVEDDDLVRGAVSHMLGSMGYGVIDARDGQAAAEILDRGTDVDLLFTDLVMPGGLSGLALAAEARKRRPGLQILLTSGYRRDSDPFGPGGVAVDEEVQFIAKPFRQQELGELLLRILERPQGDDPSRAAHDHQPHSAIA
jgi:signal transduction histidine kinase/DNA-binding response OmpR family regulator